MSVATIELKEWLNAVSERFRDYAARSPQGLRPPPPAGRALGGLRPSAHLAIPAEAAGRAAFFLSGGVPGESFGCSVAGAGDVNGDGYGDVIVGAYQSGPVGQPVGRAYIYFGGLRPQNRPDVILSGEAVGDAFGV